MSDSPSRRKMPSWLPQLLGYALSIGCLLWVLHGYRFNDLMPAILSLDWRWVSVAILADLAVYVAHGWRWNTLLAPVVRLRLWRTVQAIFIGLFANEVLPLRAGELIRCYLLAHWSDLRLSLSFASAAVERLIDGVWMLLACKRDSQGPHHPGADPGRAHRPERRRPVLDGVQQAPGSGRNQ